MDIDYKKVSNVGYTGIVYEGEFTDAGESPIIDTRIGFMFWTFVQTNDCSSTGPDVRFEGSIDGTAWFELDRSNAIGGDMSHVIFKPVRYIRIRVWDIGDGTHVRVKVYAFR